MYYLLNGELVDDACALSIHNRAFQYGDSLFETINFRNGRALFINDHLERLRNGMQLLHFNIPSFLNAGYLAQQCNLLCKKNNLEHAARIRLQCFRSGNGYYLPDKHDPVFVITVSGNNSSKYFLNNAPVKMEMYNSNPKPLSPISNIKNGSALIYVLASIFAKQQDANDCYLVNTSGNVIEATASNVFIISGSHFFTPPLSDGCVAGIMRKQVISLLNSMQLVCIEKSITQQDIANADEILLTNVIKGLTRVKCNSAYESLLGRLITALNTY